MVERQLPSAWHCAPAGQPQLWQAFTSSAPTHCAGKVALDSPPAEAAAPWDDFTKGTYRRVIADPGSDKVTRLLLCSGKVYFDLVAERRKRKIDDIAILRIEQLYPFPINRLGMRLSQYPNAEVVWCQEEPENMGAWHFVDRRIDKALSAIDVKAKRPVYVGRPEAASPATGSARTHLKEQADLVDRALTIG